MYKDSFGGHETADNHKFAAPNRQQAMNNLKTGTAVPAVESFGEEAISSMTTKKALPPSPIPSGGQSGPETQLFCATSETGATFVVTTPKPVPPSRTIDALIELQRQRIFCIKSQSRCDRSCEAFIARYLGYSSPKEKDKERSGEKERKAIFARAAAIRKAVEKGGPSVNDDQSDAAPEAGGEGQTYPEDQKENALSDLAPIILPSAIGREAWDNRLLQVKKQMRELAKSLPVYEWTKGIAGFGELGLAIIIGETGDLNNYDTKERVWKRLGLAVIEGERQQKRTNIEQAAAHGYNPRRRAEIWTIADSMFKHQWHGAKDGLEAGPTGPYGVIYANRKSHTETREGWSLKHRDNDARRVMTKALVEDLWKVWRSLRNAP